MLAFEPPHFSSDATLGGCIATGLSGPRRAFAGAARDFVLGMTIITGKAEIARFGGEVMKNVAGYDVSRLMVGSLGTLGLILDVSLKVLPKPEAEITINYELTERAALTRVNKFCVSALPISATCFDGNRLYLRLSGTQSSVHAAQIQLGGEELENASDFWHKIREQTHSFFKSNKPLWRLSLASATPPLDIEGKQLIEWRGAQRWLFSDADSQRIREKVSSVGGHATLFRHAIKDVPVFHPLQGKLHELNLNLKLAMDPHCLFNPGRMFEDY
jgi:glycolate oxidase FAD binding subunit